MTLDDMHMQEPEWVWVEEFDDESTRKFVADIFTLFEMNPEKPIVIYINSYGGSVHNLLAMVDAMDAIRSMAPESFSFITVAVGKAISAGAMILSHGDYRFASPNTSIMLHQVQGGLWGGSMPENRIEFIEMEKLNEKVLTLLQQNCKFKGEIKALESILEQNLYLQPEEARSFGLIDIVGFPKIRELRAYELAVLNGSHPEEKPKVKKKAKKKVTQPKK